MSPTLPPARSIYVSTSLEIWEPRQSDLLARDVTLNGVCFRGLDPEYYAWLRHKLTLAEKTVEVGKIAYETFDTLVTRFNEIHMWAVDTFGREALASGMESVDHRKYVPPGTGLSSFPRRAVPAPQDSHNGPSPYPREGDRSFEHNVCPSAMAKVDAIRDQALSLGWKEPLLYQTHGRYPFPSGQDYGLVCFLNEEKRIGEVSAQYIEIIGPPPRESRQRFFNPDVDQPWIKRKER